jgi:hypothetical protein
MKHTNDIIRMAREAGLTVGTNISGVMLVGSPSTPGIAHIDIDELQRFATIVAAAEREKVTFGLVNEAQKAMQEAVWAEREECAKVCEEAPEPDGHDLADRIRARGNT